MSRNVETPEAMLFDLDGTLFKTETLIVPVYEAVFAQLRKENLFEGETPPVQRMLDSLGMLLEHIWQNVMPESSAETRRRADELLLQYQLEGLARGVGELYPGVAETLKTLHGRGIRLFVASNGLLEYVRDVVAHKGLAPLFEKLYSAGEFRTRSKVDLVRLLLQTHGIRTAWMVGDRSSDVEAGGRNGLPVVGCDYAGFRKEGELDGADMRIAAFPELLSLV